MNNNNKEIISWNRHKIPIFSQILYKIFKVTKRKLNKMENIPMK